MESELPSEEQVRISGVKSSPTETDDDLTVAEVFSDASVKGARQLVIDEVAGQDRSLEAGGDSTQLEILGPRTPGGTGPVARFPAPARRYRRLSAEEGRRLAEPAR